MGERAHERIAQRSQATIIIIKDVKTKLDALLKAVIDGNLRRVTEALKADPTLFHVQGTVKNWSDRTFKDITAFQYAVWALDSDLWNEILTTVPQFKKEAAEQLEALFSDELEFTKTHGTCYSFEKLLSCYETLMTNWSPWTGEQINTYWCKEIGSAQRSVPSWVVYTWAEQGDKVAWVQQDFTMTVKRDETPITWWYTRV